MKRLHHFGRLSVYLEPRDIWVGVYIAPDAVYVCPLPLCLFRWQRAVQEADPWANVEWCDDCRLPDPYKGKGDGIGSCDCPRCECGDPRWLCDGHDDPGQYDLDDDGWDGPDVITQLGESR